MDVKCHFTDAETYVGRVEVYSLGAVFPFLPSRFHLSLFSAEKQADRVRDEVSRPVHRSFSRVACFTVMRSLRDCCGETSLENHFIGVKLASALTFHYL